MTIEEILKIEIYKVPMYEMKLLHTVCNIPEHSDLQFSSIQPQSSSIMVPKLLPAEYFKLLLFLKDDPIEH